MAVGKKDYLSRLQTLLVFLILNGMAKTKLAILPFLCCGEIAPLAHFFSFSFSCQEKLSKFGGPRLGNPGSATVYRFLISSYPEIALLGLSIAFDRLHSVYSDKMLLM